MPNTYDRDVVVPAPTQQEPVKKQPVRKTRPIRPTKKPRKES